MDGPFAGMRYGPISQGSAYIPKLLGIYEKELYPLIGKVVEMAPAMIVDIGAAEGYYAVGLARLLPKARVIAFEMENSGREALAHMVGLNHVADTVQIRGKCEPTDLEDVLAKEAEPVVICDVEGYEIHLLDLDRVPSLAKASILVELHDFIVPEITQILRSRFSSTHQIHHIWQEPRSPKEFPWRTLVTSLLPASYLNWCVSEWRPVKMAWFWMTPLKED